MIDLNYHQSCQRVKITVNEVQYLVGIEAKSQEIFQYDKLEFLNKLTKNIMC